MNRSSPPHGLAAWIRHKRLSRARPFLWAIGVQAIVLGLTVFVVVFIPPSKEAPDFAAHKTIYLPQREIDHQVALASFNQVSSPPVMMERIQVQSMVADNLPALPSVPHAAFTPMVTPDTLPPSPQMLGAAGLTALAGKFAHNATQLSFFGVADQGQRILIAFDVSKSVLDKAERSGIPFSSIREETARLIDSFNTHTSFSVIQFVRRFDTFRETLIPATIPHKRQARQWLDTSFHTSGTSPSHWQHFGGKDGIPAKDGIQGVLETAFSWEPDVIFIISDGGFGRNLPSRKSEIDLAELARDIERLQQLSSQKARIHFIGFQIKPARESGIRSIVNRYGGTFQSF